MTFQLPPNIPLGTYITDGLRTGPNYQTAFTAPQVGTETIVNDYDRYGKGVLLSPISTWDMVPYGDTAFVNPIPAVVAAAGWMTLANGGTGAATLVTSNVNTALFPIGAPQSSYVQFDWPRVPQIVIAGGPIGAARTVTIFGSDWYGFPLQHDYTINATGNYPQAISQTDTAFAYKAFYRITGVYISGGTGAATLSIRTSPFFGLPYVCSSWAKVNEWGWNNANMKDQYGNTTLVAGTATVNTPALIAFGGSGFNPNMVLGRSPGASAGAIGIPTVQSQTFPLVNTVGSFVLRAAAEASGAAVATDVSIYGWMLPDGGRALFAPAVSAASTATTGDVRGVFQLPQTGETWQQVPDAATRCVLSFYTAGANQWLNQLAAGNQPQGAGTVPPLTKADLYGVDQYFTGVHP